MTMMKTCPALAAVMFATSAALAGPPTYQATVLPQLDSTDDPNILTRTDPWAISDTGEVTGALGDGRGFIWSPDGSVNFVQPHFAEAADNALGTGINSAGDICGSYTPVGGFFLRPFRFSADGVFTPLPTLGENLNGGAAGMNDAGMIVGSAETAPGGMFGGPSTSVYWLDGEIFEIGNFGGPAGGAVAVNNHNVVVGSSNTGFGAPLQPYRWTQQTGMEPLPQLVSGVPATPADLNDEGVIVGRGGVSLFANEAVYWDADGNIHQLPRLYSTSDVGVLAVNNAGVMVGHEMTPDFFPEARLWHDGGVHNLQDLVSGLDAGVHLRRAVDINGAGQIVVEARIQVNGQPQNVAVVLTPGPTTPVGDLDGDGSVGVSDLLILLAEWGSCADPGNCPADLDGDGSVGVSDLLILLANWG